MDSPEQRTRVSRRSFFATAGSAALTVTVLGCSSQSSDEPDAAGGNRATTTTTATSSSTVPGDAGTAAPGDGSPTAGEGTPATTVFTAADFAALGTCVLSPEQTEGPFPTRNPIERRDIREDLAGHPLRLGLQVVDEACAPLPGAMVEIWHCDTDGDYSEYLDRATSDDAGPGTTFLRGAQRANGDGIVEFVTNYPGWYRGRAVHIHTKVVVDDSPVLTSQIYFADELNDEIATEAPYSAHGVPDTPNASDSVSRGDPAANGSQAVASTDGPLGGTRALLVLGAPVTAASV